MTQATQVKNGQITLKNGKTIQWLNPNGGINRSGCFGVSNTKIPDGYYSAQPFLEKKPLADLKRA